MNKIQSGELFIAIVGVLGGATALALKGFTPSFWAMGGIGLFAGSHLVAPNLASTIKEWWQTRQRETKEKELEEKFQGVSQRIAPKIEVKSPIVKGLQEKALLLASDDDKLRAATDLLLWTEKVLRQTQGKPDDIGLHESLQTLHAQLVDAQRGNPRAYQSAIEQLKAVSVQLEASQWMYLELFQNETLLNDGHFSEDHYPGHCQEEERFYPDPVNFQKHYGMGQEWLNERREVYLSKHLTPIVGQKMVSMGERAKAALEKELSGSGAQIESLQHGYNVLSDGKIQRVDLFKVTYGSKTFYVPTRLTLDGVRSSFVVFQGVKDAGPKQIFEYFTKVKVEAPVASKEAIEQLMSQARGFLGHLQQRLNDSLAIRRSSNQRVEFGLMQDNVRGPRIDLKKGVELIGDLTRHLTQSEFHAFSERMLRDGINLEEIISKLDEEVLVEEVLQVLSQNQEPSETLRGQLSLLSPDRAHAFKMMMAITREIDIEKFFERPLQRRDEAEALPEPAPAPMSPEQVRLSRLLGEEVDAISKAKVDYEIAARKALEEQELTRRQKLAELDQLLNGDLDGAVMPEDVEAIGPVPMAQPSHRVLEPRRSDIGERDWLGLAFMEHEAMQRLAEDQA